MTPSESTMQFVNRVKLLAARKKAMGVVTDDREMAMAVLNGPLACFPGLTVALDDLGTEQKGFGLSPFKS